MSSAEKLTSIKEKLKKWQSDKELEILRQVVLLKKLTARKNNISTNFIKSVYTDIVNDVDKLRGS